MQTYKHKIWYRECSVSCVMLLTSPSSTQAVCSLDEQPVWGCQVWEPDCSSEVWSRRAVRRAQTAHLYAPYQAWRCLHWAQKAVKTSSFFFLPVHLPPNKGNKLNLLGGRCYLWILRVCSCQSHSWQYLQYLICPLQTNALFCSGGMMWKL